MYNPDLGTFDQRDPIGYDGGDDNLYRYCGNNPLNATDPGGDLTIKIGHPNYYGAGQGTWLGEFVLGANETTGWLVQKITTKWEVHACPYEQVNPAYRGCAPYGTWNTEDPSKFGELVYWEMWRVVNGQAYGAPSPDAPLNQRLISLRDLFKANANLGQVDTWGYYSQKGEAAFISGLIRPKAKGGWRVDPTSPAGGYLWTASNQPAGWGTTFPIQVTREWHFKWNHCKGQDNYDASTDPNHVLDPNDLNGNGGWDGSGFQGQRE